MFYPSKKLNEMNASLKKLSIGNQKSDNANDDDDDDDDDGDMIPSFAGDTKIKSTSVFHI